jgi:hypothetical protein
MIGGGAITAVGIANHADWIAVGNTIGDPNSAYRLILGVGPDSEIHQRIIASEGVCPSFTRVAEGGVMWGWYIVALPRLEATVARFTPGNPVLRRITAWADENIATSQRKAFDLYTVDRDHKRAAFSIFCSHGHVYPATAEKWGVAVIH